MVDSAIYCILALQPEMRAPCSTMVAKVASLIFAVAALAGAVIFAQQKGREKPRPNPVFDTSKSGTPTPIDATEEEKEAIRKANAAGDKTEPQQKPQKKPVKVMPSSKSYIPDNPR